MDLDRQRVRPLRRRAKGWSPPIAVLVVAGLLVLGPRVAAADEGDEVAPAEVVPVEQLLREVRERFEGQILKVELDQEWRPHGRIWVYEAKLLTPEGQVLKVEYDARSLELIEVERPKARGAGRPGPP